jgi:hypothetical protein
METVRGGGSGFFTLSPDKTTVLKITLDNPRRTAYDLDFLGRDTDFAVRDECHFDGPSVIYVTLAYPEGSVTEKVPDITLRLVPKEKGYMRPDGIRLPLECAVRRVAFLYAGMYASPDTVKKLTLCFDADIEGFSTDNITFADNTTAFVRSFRLIAPGVYEVEAEGITGKPPDVAVNPEGYVVNPPSLPVTVGKDGPVRFLGAAPDSSSGAITGLYLYFDQGIAGLAWNDITIDGPATVVPETLRNDFGMAGIYRVALDVTGGGTITVTVNKDGVAVDPPSQKADVSLTPVTFAGLEADGTAGAVTTKSLTLTFDKEIVGLKKEHVTISSETAALQAVSVESIVKTDGGPGGYTLALADTDALEDSVWPAETFSGAIAVTVKADAVPGYRIAGSPQQTMIHVVPPRRAVEFKALAANGTAGTVTTTQLTLTFDKEIAGLKASDITLNAETTGALSGSGPAYTLGISGITAEGNITVIVQKTGYSISPASKTVQVYMKTGVLAGAANMPSIKAKFGVTATGTAGVAAAFNELHAYIQKGGLAETDNVIKLGDWIDLEGGLAVAAYGGSDNKGGGAFVHDAAKAVQAVTYNGADWGTLCRLIVVGVNSFNGKNGNSTPHVVFQFQNIPVTRRMNSGNTNTGGYASSEMRTYLTGNFLTGLNNAGVPDGVLWGPERYLSAGVDGTGTTKITDKLWLPTEREMSGSDNYIYSADGETEANQARLEYYTDDSICVKLSGLSAMWYWTGSAYSGSSASFCSVASNGISPYSSASSAGGVAPAFCVY